jgi:hypothetical protein
MTSAVNDVNHVNNVNDVQTPRSPPQAGVGLRFCYAACGVGFLDVIDMVDMVDCGQRLPTKFPAGPKIDKHRLIDCTII